MVQRQIHCCYIFPLSLGKKVRPAVTGEMYINMRSIFYNSQKDINVKTEQKQTPHHTVHHTEIYQTFLYIQRRVYLLSAVIGDTKRPFNTCKGYLGLLVWVMNLCIHFAFDFYEAHDVFHVSWATSIGIYLVMFVMCTAFMIRHSMRWYVRLVKKLTKDDIYLPTLKKLKFIFKVSEFMLIISRINEILYLILALFYILFVRSIFNDNFYQKMLEPDCKF